MANFKNQNEFPLLNLYKEYFVIDDDTIFAYDNTIYSNEFLRPDLLIHELFHLEQQKAIGADNWVNKYLNDNQFRLDQEVEAFQKQLSSIKDRNERMRIRIKSAQSLSGKLYGGIINFNEAIKLLK